MNVFIVDDEPLAREELKELLSDCEDIEIIGEFGNGIECLKALPRLQPDVLFLDIEMPMISGLELATMLDMSNAPDIIFVTAYDQFAIQAFEQNAVDYLLKPIQKPRLLQSLNRLRNRAANEPPAFEPMLREKKLTLIPCHHQQTVRLIRLEDLEFAFSDVSGVHLWNGQTQIHTQLTLKVLESKTDFIRCHRQYLIQPAAICEIRQNDDGNATAHTVSGQLIPVSRRYFKTIRDLFSIN